MSIAQVDIYSERIAEIPVAEGSPRLNAIAFLDSANDDWPRIEIEYTRSFIRLSLHESEYAIRYAICLAARKRITFTEIQF